MVTLCATSSAPTPGLLDEDLAAWIEQNVTFPSTMVDRIVPAVTAETLDKITQLTGVRDPAGVACVNLPSVGD